MAVAKTYQEQLERIKKNIRNSFDYFKPNYDRFNFFNNFVFNTSITTQNEALLNELGKPIIEVNTSEAFISRLEGEFSKAEPSISVSSQDNVNTDPKVIQVVEGHLRHIFFEANKNGCGENIYKDTLAGGFSDFKITMDYINSKSFDQSINLNRPTNPVLCFFDPLAQLPHKGDGNFCGECFPIRKKDFQEQYPDADILNVSFTRQVEGFNWSYKNQGNEEILVVCDYYEKKKTKKKLVKLVDEQIMYQEEYEELVKKYEEEARIEVPPAIVDTRSTTLDKICRYRLIENQVIEYKETNFYRLPLVFVDGNSVMLNQGGTYQQMTRPYLWNVKGLQQLQNCAIQNLAHELEMMVQHKLLVAKEAIPDEYVDVYTDIQKAKVLVYNAYKESEPNVQLPPPQLIARPPIPQEILATLGLADQKIQAVLGSYDATLGVNDKDISGKAIIEGAMQSNAASLPYINGYLQALNQIAAIIVELIPLYYVTPRTIPVMKPDGSRDYVRINDPQDPQSISLQYDHNVLQVKVEAGPSFSVQKTKALQQITAMMQASPLFAQFMNQEGLSILLDNMEMRGIDQLKAMAAQFMQQVKQQQAQAQQMQAQAMQNNPMMIKAANERIKIQQDAQQAHIDNSLKMAELQLEKQSLDNDTLKINADLHTDQIHNMVMIDKADAEKARASLDYLMKLIDMRHQHEKDNIEMGQKVVESKNNQEHPQEIPV